jgi:hypothetical protein
VALSSSGSTLKSPNRFPNAALTDAFGVPMITFLLGRVSCDRRKEQRTMMLQMQATIRITDVPSQS